MSCVTTEHLNRRIAAATGIVMTSVLLSRILGFFRDWTVAHQIGANASTSAYYTAFTLPDFLNYLIAGGSLSVTFIPVFAKYVTEKREDEGWRVFSTVVTVMGFALVTLVILGEIFAAHLVKYIAPGFKPAELQQTIFLTRLMLPAQICFYEGSILSAVQYAKGHFVIPSLAPLVYNIGIIIGGVLLSSRIGITGFAVGVLGGAIAGNLLLQIYGAHRVGAIYFPNFNVRHPGFWMFLKLSVPIMLALSLSFVDDWIIRWFGSYLQPASITWLSYGKTLMRVPLGLVGQAIGVASFPILAQLYSEKKMDDLNRILNSTFKALIFLLLPISALIIAQSEPLVYLAFSRTRLHGPDLTATASALAFFSLGVIRVGRAEYSGTGLLCDARHDYARRGRHGDHPSESSRILGAGAPAGFSRLGTREHDWNYRLYYYFVRAAGAAHAESRRGKPGRVFSESCGCLLHRGLRVLPIGRAAGKFHRLATYWRRIDFIGTGDGGGRAAARRAAEAFSSSGT